MIEDPLPTDEELAALEVLLKPSLRACNELLSKPQQSKTRFLYRTLTSSPTRQMAWRAKGEVQKAMSNWTKPLR